MDAKGYRSTDWSVSPFGVLGGRAWDRVNAGDMEFDRPDGTWTGVRRFGLAPPGGVPPGPWKTTPRDLEKRPGP